MPSLSIDAVFGSCLIRCKDSRTVPSIKQLGDRSWLAWIGPIDRTTYRTEITVRTVPG